MEQSPGIIGEMAGWLEHPWSKPINWRMLALVLALLLIVLWLLHDGHRIAREAAGL